MTSRKDFIAATTAIAALAPSVARAATPAAPATSAAKDAIPPFIFDRARFATIATKDVKHRHSYASRDIEDALVLDTIKNVLDAYEDSLGEKPASVTSIGVLYHGKSVLLAFNDKVWNELVIPAAAKMSTLSDLKGMAVGDGNPYLHAQKDSDYDGSIETLAARGSYLMACNNATSGFASGLANALGLKSADVYARLAGGLVPNAMLVPAGVWAIHALQEVHFTYQQVNL